jgi:hypothetical protein
MITFITINGGVQVSIARCNVLLPSATAVSIFKESLI